jgi:hypothetical protein
MKMACGYLCMHELRRLYSVCKRDLVVYVSCQIRQNKFDAASVVKSFIISVSIS